jgi:hypothetical protein
LDGGLRSLKQAAACIKTINAKIGGPGMTEREMGELSARVTAIERDMRGIRSDTREIRDALLTLRGGKRMLIVVIGAAASLGAGLATWIPAAFR